MDRPGPSDKPQHVFRAGPRPLAQVLPAVTRPALRATGAAIALLTADWPGIVGHTLAEVTMPRRLAAGTLTLGCAGPVALELQHLSGQLIERINTHFGRAAVQRLRLVQEAVSLRRPASRAARRVSTPVQVDGVPPGPLRDALAALGGAVRSERA